MCRSGRVVVYALLGYAVETTDPAAVARFGRAQAADAQVRAAVAFVEPEVLAVGARAAPRLGGGRPGAGGVRPLPRRSRPACRAHALRRGRGGARSRLRRLRRAVRGLQRAHRQRCRLRARRVGATGAQVDGDPGLDRHAARERRPDVAAERLGELRRRLPRRAQRAGGEPRRHDQAGGVPGARPPARVAARGVALAVERPGRGLRQPDRDVRGESADLAPLLAACGRGSTASTGSRRTTSRRRSGRPRRSSSTSSASSGSARRSSRSAATYADTVRRGCLEERWVDVYPTAGKMGGAFSAGSPGTAPFIVMSFDGTAVSLGTLAHELGHSMHSYLTWQSQPQVYTHYTMFVGRGRVELPPGDAPRATCSRPSPIRRCSSPCSRRRWRTSAATSSSCPRSPGSSASSTSGSREAKG